MNEKTEELRDIFLDVTEEETVTESQEELRGSVTDSGTAQEEFLPVIEEMQEKFKFETELSNETLEEIVALFYEDCDDEAIAEELSCAPESVFEARMDLHLVREDDPPAVEADETTWETVRERTDASEATLADSLTLDSEAIEHIRRVIETKNRSRRVSQRFRIAFEERLTDADLKHQLAADAQRDGLDDATEDAEVDVEF